MMILHIKEEDKVEFLLEDLVIMIGEEDLVGNLIQAMPLMKEIDLIIISNIYYQF